MRSLLPTILFAGLLSAAVANGAPPSPDGPWKADWEQLRARPYPKWFTDAKLGIFIHWGVYSVPSWAEGENYAEWYLRGLDMGDEGRIAFMKKHFGEEFTYREFAPMFKAELFDAGEWAELFRRSGARYVLLVSKHHDGYCLWPSKFAPNWNSMEVGPKRDLVGEISAAVRAEGLKMGLYYSLPEWNHPLHRWYTDPHKNIGPYVEKHMIPQFKELVSTYKPSVIFADGEWFNKAEEWHAAELISWYFNLVGDEAIVNDRWGHGSKIGYRTPEYSAGITDTSRPWTEVRGLGRSFGLNRNEKLDAYMSPTALIHFFANAVAHGGGITLNVGPEADGRIPLLQQERLLQLGRWLTVNGEAIYGSTHWKRHTEEREVTLERIDPKVDFDWVRSSPGTPVREDHFTAEWNGFVQARFSETYTLEAEADEGVRVWIDGQPVIDRWTATGEAAEGNVNNRNEEGGSNGLIALQAGHKHAIKVAYHEKKQNARIHLSWSSASQAKEIVPQSQLFSTRDLATGDGLKAVYRSLAPYICYTRNNDALYAIVLDWPGAELLIPVEHEDRPVQVSLLGFDKPLPHQATKDGIRIDLSKIYPNDLPCQHAWTFKIEGL